MLRLALVLGEEEFAAGDAVVAKASLLGGKVSSIIAACKSVPKAEEDPTIDPSQGETEAEVKAKKPADVENACFFRVLVNAADKK